MRRPGLKSIFLGIGVVLWTAVVCSGLYAFPSNQPSAEPSRVAVVSAFSRELTPIIASADIQSTRFVNGRTHYLGRLAGSEVVLVLVGIGLAASGSATQALIDSFDISAILFSGIAGGINPDLRIGDVAIPARWRQADNPATADAGWYEVDPGMLAAALTVLDSVELGSCTIGGTCLGYRPEIVADGNGVSNPYFVDDPAYRDWLWDTLQADVVDMETSAVMEVADNNQIPFLAVRCISDLAGGGGDNQVNTYLELAADNAAAVSTNVLEAWTRSLGFGAQSRRLMEGYGIMHCFPNPFNPATTITFDLPGPGETSLIVYDLLGREVIHLAHGYRLAGQYQFHWETGDWQGREVPAGIYVARLVTPRYSSSIKMLLLK